MQQNDFRHTDAIAASAGVTRCTAQKALHMAAKATARNLTVAQMSEEVGLEPSTIKRYSRRFGITLADYNPFANQHRKTRGNRLAYTNLRWDR